jgi:peptidoglycan/LPS O-acetylase OafA/YrhL
VQPYPTIAADVVCVALFAVIGRSSHGESVDPAGVLHTAWPFLVGCLAGLLVGRVWRRPAAIATGVVVWLSTGVIGVALRLVSGTTAQWSFVLVALTFLGLTVVGWRAVLGLTRRWTYRY